MFSEDPFPNVRGFWTGFHTASADVTARDLTRPRAAFAGICSAVMLANVRGLSTGSHTAPADVTRQDSARLCRDDQPKCRGHWPACARYHCLLTGVCEGHFGGVADSQPSGCADIDRSFTRRQRLMRGGNDPKTRAPAIPRDRYPSPRYLEETCATFNECKKFACSAKVWQGAKRISGLPGFTGEGISGL